jgi:hypothetical protein
MDLKDLWNSDGIVMKSWIYLASGILLEEHGLEIRL